MAFDWIKKLGGGTKPKRTDNGTDRNAVIRTIVSAAADETKKSADAAATAVADAPAKPLSVRTPTPAPRPGLGDPDIPRDKVAQRAFEIWVRKGRPFGTSDQDWLQAEAELMSESLYRPDVETPGPNKPR